MTRRTVLAGAIAAGAAPLLPREARAQARVRKNVTGPTSDPAMLDAYKTAVKAMLQLPPSDPRNWYRQGLVHLNDCPHQNWWFLPWHRGYLLHFEQICAQLSGKADFALPFWDWTASPSVPSEMFVDVMTPTNAAYEANFASFRNKFQQPVQAYFNGLSAAQRADLNTRGLPSASAIMSAAQGSWVPRTSARGLTPQNPNFDSQSAAEVTLTKIRDALAPTSFETFGSDQAAQHSDQVGESLLESGPHDNVHGAVNGFMGAFMSPTDPIFFMHHANIDRLWSIWTKREKSQGRTGRPQANADWIKEPFRFFSNAAGQALPNATSGDYAEIDTLGYSYGPGSGDIGPLPAPIAVAPVQVLATANANLQLKTFLPATLPIPLAPERKDTFTNLTAARATPEPSSVVARVTIKPPSGAKNYRLRIFCNCPYLNKNTPLIDPHYVGSINFFAVGHSAHAGHEATYTLPLGQTLQRLSAVGNNPGDQIRLQVMAVDATGQSKPLDGALTKVTIQTI